MNFRFAVRKGFGLVLSFGILIAVVQPRLQVVSAADNAPQYHVAQRWPLTGPGGSGYLLVSGRDHRLYLSRDTELTVVDTTTGKTIGEIRDLTDVRGVALDPERKSGYIGDGISGALRVFNVPMMKLTSSVKIGGTPDAVIVDPVTRRIFVFDSHNKTAVVVDSSSLEIIGTVKLPGHPAGAIANGDGTVFVNLASTSQLARLDARTLSEPTLTPLHPCVGPSGIALDAAHSHVFSVCENKLMAISDGRTGEFVASVPVGEGAKTVGFDSADKLVFSANGEGTLSVIREDEPTKFTTDQTIKTEPGARTMAYDEERGQLYLVSARFGQRTGPTSEELEFRPTPVPGSSVVLVMKP